MAIRDITKGASKIQRKRIVLGEPKSGDVSQYTFDTNDPLDSRGYSDSTSLPKNNDKFQDKDLNITTVGSTINEKIIEKNIKAIGSTFFRIDKCFVEYIGTPTNLKDVRVKMWLMNDKYVQDNDKSIYGFDNLLSLVNLNDAEDRVFEYNAGRLASGVDLGNLSFIEGVNILTDLGDPSLTEGSAVTATFPADDSFSYQTNDYNPELMLPSVSTGGNFTVFDKGNFNPIIMIFEITAHGENPDDKRDSQWQVFRINNQELYDTAASPDAGLQKTFTYEEMFTGNYHGNESGGGVEDPALKITDFQVTINTKVSPPNVFTDSNIYEEYFSQILPSIPFSPTDKKSLLMASPYQELNNTGDPGFDYGAFPISIFPDYFPKQHIGILNSDSDTIVPDVYLDEYRDGSSEEIQALGSAPSSVTFDFEICFISNLSNSNVRALEEFMPTTSGDGKNAEVYYYFVINWDDIENEIKTIDDWLQNRPTTLRELLELNQDNLYILARHKQFKTALNDYRIETDIRLSNIYTTPGIKTIKTIMFSYDEQTEQVGRWKLITSRFYLDIPYNQKPDFGELGGQAFTTIPWPYTTPVIGGVSEDSKYKKSVQDALSSGNIGRTDIIDESLLINDLENDELGKNIESMDFEQLRYFNKPYGINDLLNLSYIEELIGEPIYKINDEHLRTLPGYFGGGVIDGDPPMTSNELSWLPVGSSNPAFGENGYLLTHVDLNYNKLKTLWTEDGDKILQAMNDFLYYNLDINNWIYTEDEFDGFIYDGFISAETGLFVNDMAIAIYKLETGLYPIIPEYQLNTSDVNQWNGIGRPDIADFVTNILENQPEANINPPEIDEDGNQTLVGGTGGGWSEGGIDEGGIDGSEPHFQGGVPGPGGSEGGVDVGGGTGGGSDFIPGTPQLDLTAPAGILNVSSGDMIELEWEQIEDYSLHNDDDTKYGPAFSDGDPPAYYFDKKAQENQNANGGNPSFRFWDGMSPVAFKAFRVYLDEIVNNQAVEKFYIGYFTETSYSGNFIASAGYTTTGIFTRKLSFAVPTAEEYGILESGIQRTFKIRLETSSLGLDPEGQELTSTTQSSLQLTFNLLGGEAPPVGTRPKKYFENTTFVELESSLPFRYNQVNPNGSLYWDGINHKFPMESSVGQIFINDNQDNDLKNSCQIELNTGELTGKSIYDSSGGGKKGLLIGDYKIKKTAKGQTMRRDSFIKVPKKASSRNGAL